jgi:predicted negative regulator of RcsB-dependent stress response
MADSYNSEDEQVEALKKWWQENGKSTVITIVVVLAAIFGWRGWQQQQSAEVEAGSLMYQSLLMAVSANGGQLTEAQQATAQHLADSLKVDFPKSSYATYAALFNAQFAVKNNNLDRAVEELNWVLARDIERELFLQATLRLARVYSAQGKSTEALALLDIDAGVYAPAYEEVRGDIYKSLGQLEEALMSYQKASELNMQAEPPVANGVLTLKLEHLTNQLAAAEGDS